MTSKMCINICLLVFQPQTMSCKWLFSKSNTSGRSTKAWRSNVARSAHDARGADLMAMIINTDHVLMRMLKLLLRWQKCSSCCWWQWFWESNDNDESPSQCLRPPRGWLGEEGPRQPPEDSSFNRKFYKSRLDGEQVVVFLGGKL